MADNLSERVACASRLETGGGAAALVSEWVKEMWHGTNPVKALENADTAVGKRGADCLAKFPELNKIVYSPSDFY